MGRDPLLAFSWVVPSEPSGLCDYQEVGEPSLQCFGGWWKERERGGEETKGGNVDLLVECLLNMHKALNLIQAPQKPGEVSNTCNPGTLQVEDQKEFKVIFNWVANWWSVWDP